jgi:ribokinase
MKKFKYVGVGFCSNDDISLLPEIPIDSKVKIITHTIQGGGPAATSTVAAARLGLDAAFIGTVGDDDAGVKILKDFQAEGVNTDAVVVRKGRTSPVAYCWVDEPTGKRSVAWTRGDTEELEEAEVNLDILNGASVLHMDGHNPKGALAAAKRAKELGVLVNFDAGTVRDGVAELLPYADILIASEAFARSWTGENDLKKALVKLAEYGSKVVGCTMGELGSMMYDNGKYIECPAFKISPVDTTGAGDVFHTSFAVRYLETQDLYECQRFGAAVSAIKCGKLGGRAGIPSRSVVDEFLANNK